MLTNVAYVSDLRYRLSSLPTLIENGHAFEEGPIEIIVRLKSEGTIVFPLSMTSFSLYGYRVDSSSRQRTPVVYWPQGNRQTSLPLASPTSIALLDTRGSIPKDRGAARDHPRRGVAGVQGVLHGAGSSQGHQAVHAHTNR